MVLLPSGGKLFSCAGVFSSSAPARAFTTPFPWPGSHFNLYTIGAPAATSKHQNTMSIYQLFLFTIVIFCCTNLWILYSVSIRRNAEHLWVKTVLHAISVNLFKRWWQFCPPPNYVTSGEFFAYINETNKKRLPFNWRQTTHEQDTVTCLFASVTLTLNRWPWYTNLTCQFCIRVYSLL